jgi:hypothetical protein
MVDPGPTYADTLAASAELFDGMGMSFHAGRALLSLGERLRRDRSPADARHALRKARRLFEAAVKSVPTRQTDTCTSSG